MVFAVVTMFPGGEVVDALFAEEVDAINFILSAGAYLDARPAECMEVRPMRVL